MHENFNKKTEWPTVQRFQIPAFFLQIDVFFQPLSAENDTFFQPEVKFIYKIFPAFIEKQQ